MSDKITKNDIIDSLINDSKIDRQDISALMDSIFNQINCALSEGKTVELRGFGTFSPRLRSATKARNPQTGETVKLDERYYAFFKPGKDLAGKMMKLKINTDEK